MKIRIVQRPEYTQIYHLQIKKWWYPFWVTLCVDCLPRVQKLADDMVKHGQPFTIIFEAEVKNEK